MYKIHLLWLLKFSNPHFAWLNNVKSTHLAEFKDNFFAKKTWQKTGCFCSCSRHVAVMEKCVHSSRSSQIPAAWHNATLRKLAVSAVSWFLPFSPSCSWIIGYICHDVYIYIYVYWLVVSISLKNMSSSVGMMTFPTEWKVIKHVPNHQSVYIYENYHISYYIIY